MEEVFHNLEFENGSHGVTVRHSQMRHLIQGRASDQHLRRLPSKLPRADSPSEDRFHSKHLRLGQTPSVITHFLLPPLAPHFPNPPQVLIANQAFLFAVAMLPDLRIAARRDRR